jgi:glutaredoxin
MTLVEIYSKEDCHLCDVAKEVLKKVQQQHPFTLQEIYIREGDEHFENFKERIPVIFINKQFAYQYRVHEKDFIAKLQGNDNVKRFL